MTAAQRLREEGRQEGRQEGREEGLRTSRLLMLHMVQHRFGDQVDPHIEQRLRTATVEQIEAWSVRVLSAASLAELFADDPALSA